MYGLLDVLLGLVIPSVVVAAAFGIGWMARGAHDTRATNRIRRAAARRGSPLPPADPSTQPSHVRLADFRK